MAKTYYMPTDDDGKAALFEHFSAALPQYADSLGVSPADLASQAADAVYFRWVLNQSALARSYSQGLTGWRNKIRDGGTSALPMPLPPLHAPPPAVAPGVVPRFLALVKAIKAEKSYTSAIGAVLKIEGEDAPSLDLENAQPDLTGAKVMADQVHIPWKKLAFDGIRVEVDRGDGKGFVFLAIDTRPGFIDTEPVTAPGVWKYRAIYLLDDTKVGQWSSVVSVRVG